MNILIVDDQKWVLEGLEQSVDWKACGINIVYTAQSAKDAKLLISSMDIDILMTDIEMPQESGLELSRWLMENYPDIPCIFLTSHADFAYAREAIENGGFDYLLQPADSADVIAAVERCRLKLEERRQLRRMAKKGESWEQQQRKVEKGLAVSLLSTGAGFVRHIDEWEREINPDHQFSWYQPCLVTVRSASVFPDGVPEKCAVEEELYYAVLEELEEGMKCLCVRLDSVAYSGEECCGMVLCGTGEPFPMEKTLDFFQKLFVKTGAMWNTEPTYYVGRVGKRELPALAEEVQQKMRDNVTRHSGIFYVVQEKIRVHLRKPDAAQWREWILRGDGELVLNQISNLLEYAGHENQLNLSYLRTLHEIFTESAIQAFHDRQLQLSDVFGQGYSMSEYSQSYLTVSEFRKSVQFCLDRFRELTRQEEPAKELSMEERIQFAKDYVEQHMDEMVRRKDVAQQLYLNEDYFTRMFRQETGMGFKEYVLQQKMEYAKKLLTETTYPVSVIASRVGFDNFSNFTQAFKKYTGTTPLQFRS